MYHLFRTLLVVAGLLVGATPWPASAAPAAAEALPPLSLRDALMRSRAYNPDLAVFPLRQQEQAARRDAAALRPAPALSAEVENLFSSRADDATSRLETTLAVSQVLELGGRRQHRIAVADAAQTQLEIERQIAELDVAAEVGRRFIHLAADQARLNLAKRAVEVAEQTMRTVSHAVDAGRRPAVERGRADIARARAEIALEHAEHELLSSQRRLAAMWGAREIDFGRVSADLLSLPEDLALAPALAQLMQTPDLLRFATEARQRDAEIRLSEARARSPITVRAGLRRQAVDDDLSMVAGLSIPLFGTRQAAPALAGAQARRARVPIEADAAKLALEVQLFELLQEMRHAITEASSLRDIILPQMNAVLADTEQAWQRGRYSFLEWTEVQRERVALERALIDAASQAHTYRIELERLTGRRLAPPMTASDSGSTP